MQFRPHSAAPATASHQRSSAAPARRVQPRPGSRRIRGGPTTRPPRRRRPGPTGRCRPAPGLAVDRPETLARAHHRGHVELGVVSVDRPEVVAGRKFGTRGVLPVGGQPRSARVAVGHTGTLAQRNRMPRLRRKARSSRSFALWRPRCGCLARGGMTKCAARGHAAGSGECGRKPEHATDALSWVLLKGWLCKPSWPHTM